MKDQEEYEEDIQEPVYEDVDENGEVPKARQNEITQKALEPKNPLEKKLIASQRGARRFADSKQRRRFHLLEARADGADAEQRLVYAWLEHCIAWVAKGNKYQNTKPFEAAIGYAENKEKEEAWKIKNRDEVLKKPAPQDLAKSIELDDLYNGED
jgi:hypothetical protein